MRISRWRPRRRRTSGRWPFGRKRSKRCSLRVRRRRGRKFGIGANAVRLHLNWLALHLQHGAGTETRAMLPKIIEHASAALAAHEAAEQFAESLQKAKERNP